jgi:hypothetical protein
VTFRRAEGATGPRQNGRVNQKTRSFQRNTQKPASQISVFLIQEAEEGRKALKKVN